MSPVCIYIFSLKDRYEAAYLHDGRIRNENAQSDPATPRTGINILFQVKGTLKNCFRLDNKNIKK